MIYDQVRCPVCGEPTCVRKAKGGFYAGQLFLSCKRYPRCHTILLNYCPECSSKMVLRYQKDYRAYGKFFWECSTFPKCKKRMHINDGHYYTPAAKKTYTSTTTSNSVSMHGNDTFAAENDLEYSSDEMIEDLLFALGDFDEWDPDYQETYGDAYRNYIQTYWDD